MKNILVVGGSSGIGRGIAEQLTSEGHQVWATSRTNPITEPIAGVRYLAYDASAESAPVLEMEMLDGLVYCPGSINLKPFHRLTRKDFQQDLEVNLHGAVQMIQSALPLLKKTGQAAIVLFSTVAVGQGMPYHASISAAKGAIEGLGRSLAAELTPDIRVNVIAPSIVDTPLASRILSTDEKKEASGNRHPLRRVGETKDIASMARFLLLEDSSWITGQVMAVDGGMSSIKLL